MRSLVLYILFTLITLCHGVLIHAWCYDATMLGGHIPFVVCAILVPLFCCMIGYVANMQQYTMNNKQ